MLPDAAQIVKLTPQEQRARLLQLLAKKELETKLAPLSFSQERFWLQDQLTPGSITSLSLTARIRGNLNVPVLEQSLSEIARRHESLRTSIVVEHGQPMQAIKPAHAFHLPVIGLEHFPAAARESEARHICSAELSRPFDIVQGPLFRAALVRLDVADHVLVLITQHLISDAWSLSILIQELSVLYAAFLKGQPSPLPPLPLQYADFARWQREMMQGESLERELAYWIEQVGDSPALNMPTDRPYTLAQTTTGAREPTTIPRDLCEQLKTLAQQQGCTLFMVLLSGLQVLLHRYTGQEDISVYTLVANRTVNAAEKLIGLFLNTLPLRSRLGQNLTFVEVLQQVRQVTLDAYDHQTIPFQKLLEALQARGDLKRTPSFQVILLLQNVPNPVIKLSDLDCERFVREMDFQAGMEMTLSLVETEAGLSGWIEYPIELFEAATIHRMLEHFQILLAGAVANPDQPIAELPLLSEAERQQILKEWTYTQADFPADRCIHELFEEQVDRTPDAVAVVFEQQHLTYREINQRANQLARYLRQQGVGPETFVGLCLARSPEMIVSLLGILKAGGAYVPLDPTYPTPRLAAILQDTQVRLLISQSDLTPILPAIEAPVLLLDRAWEAVTHVGCGNPDRTTGPSNLAYVIYTSGSTGRPKGVMVTHAGLVNAFWAWEDTYALRSTGGAHLQMANFVFDVFAGDWVRALCSGSRLVLCPHEFLLAPEDLYDLMCRERIACGEFVPVVVRSLMQYLRETEQSLDFMRLLVVGSDKWYIREREDLRQLGGPETRVISSYGLTEVTIDSSYFENLAVDLSGDEPVPIGRPFANTQIYILDARFQPVPIGIPGELYLGGAGLARGYLHRPELTAERFVPSPFSDEPGARLYRTGDGARYLSDGNIQFLGRIDHQVKIRGFRIELGEIEALLAQHPAVHAAVAHCLAAPDGSEDMRVVAYVVPQPEQALPVNDLRAFLKERLPEYMVPSAFVNLDALPLTPSGKVDRRALPAPEVDDQQTEYTPPETPVEERLIEIWSQVLNVSKISIHANFFDLGGHSLMATQVVYRINKALRTKLAVRDLFLEPTVARLGLLIEERLIEELERAEIA